ncbi:hypothetical protein [Nonomuraea lactucae]|uniref:hypothetical protein n=1 Tax=Nonomuraea lactucae TaxID=2249762 RepID=UPI000DE49BA4|nr:hypothetical protein [Nonomuraea lactucae]
MTITGHCGGAKALKAVVTGLDTKHSMLQNVRIIEDNPKGFVAKATLSPEVGYGVSPVLVNCAGEKGVSGPEAGVTLLVTQG